MTGKKNIMSAIPSPCTTPVVSRTPLTDFMCSRLQSEKLQLFGLMFAEAVKNDRHAKVIRFENVYRFLGYDRYNNAVRQLKNTFADSELVVDNLLTSEQVTKGTSGPSKTSYLVSVRQFETLMLNAQTTEGGVAREMMLDVKDAVQDYIKMEMEEASRMAVEREKLAQQQLEESNAQRAELEAVQAKLQATIESQKKRDEKKEARKRQQKEPMETVYIMTNMAEDNRGPYKCGKTGGDVKKRAKEMQTGNHEEMRVVASAKCVESKLVEDVMHQIFHDYRTNDRLEWFDAPLNSMKSVMFFIVECIDGLNRVDHDEVSVSDHLEQLTASMRERVSNLPSHNASPTEPEADSSQINESDPYSAFWTECMVYHGDPWKAVLRSEVMDTFVDWIGTRGLPMPPTTVRKAYLDGKLKFRHTTHGKGKERVYGYIEWAMRTPDRVM